MIGLARRHKVGKAAAILSLAAKIGPAAAGILQVSLHRCAVVGVHGRAMGNDVTLLATGMAAGRWCRTDVRRSSGTPLGRCYPTLFSSDCYLATFHSTAQFFLIAASTASHDSVAVAFLHNEL